MTLFFRTKYAFYDFMHQCLMLFRRCNNNDIIAKVRNDGKVIVSNAACKQAAFSFPLL